MYIKPLKLGNVEIPNNIFLAPMAGITDMPYRKLCKEYGAGMVYTEMVSSKAISFGNEKTKNLCEVFKDERPIGVQIFGSNPKTMAETAEYISEFADIIDINMGCPANKIVKNGEGSALMKDLKLAENIIKEVVKASNVPVTVKMRKGYDDNNINVVELAKIAEQNGVPLITVHGRTREQAYSGVADLDIIKKVKEAVSIMVIGNGDITTPQKAKYFFDYTGVDGIMIARGSMGNPWIFKNIITYLEQGILLPDPTTEEKMDLALKHLKLLVEYKGEYTAVREIRKILFAYIKNMPKAAEIRNRITTIDNYLELEKLLISMKGL